MGLALFERKFGRRTLEQIPLEPGVYLFRGVDGDVIYVGKAKRLRRRLQQYRNAKRRKKHRKMKLLLREAESLEWVTCASETDALLLENEWIREFRPRYNVAGAFSFMYPVLGWLVEGGDLHLCYTTQPAPFLKDGFQLFGAFRSRDRTREGYFALIRLLEFLGHRESPRSVRRKYGDERFSHRGVFRQVDSALAKAIPGFLRGERPEFLSDLACLLLESASARSQSAQVQASLREIRDFYRFEIQSLLWAKEQVGDEESWVPQHQRDELFIKARGEVT